jgi:hypothetical protein
MKKDLLFLTCFLVIGLINQCAQKESETFRQEKLQTRQDIDKTILKIDREVEKIKQQLPPDFSEGENPLQNRIVMLEDMREDLLKQTQSMDTVKESEWNPMKDEIKMTISRVDSVLTLWQTESQEQQKPPYPFPS